MFDTLQWRSFVEFKFHQNQEKGSNKMTRLVRKVYQIFTVGLKPCLEGYCDKVLIITVWSVCVKALVAVNKTEVKFIEKSIFFEGNISIPSDILKSS